MRTTVQKRTRATDMATNSEQIDPKTKSVAAKKKSVSSTGSRASSRLPKNENIEVTEDKPLVANKCLSKSIEKPDVKKNNLKQSDKESVDEDNPAGSSNIPHKPPRPIPKDKVQEKVKKLKTPTKEKKKEVKLDEVKEPGIGLCAILGYSMVLIVAVLGIILAPVLIPEELKSYILNEEYLQGDNIRFDYVKIFDNKLEELKIQFPNQTSRFWKIIKTRGLAHLNDKRPKQPLVILMGAPPSGHKVIDCMAWKVAEILDPGNDDLGYINGASFSKHGGDETKKIMDLKLEKLFQKGDRSALILHLELLPPPSPILFYSYCDNDNAPFKRAGIIFTVHLPEEPNPSLSPAETEGVVEQYLSDVAWSRYPYEQDAVAALLSRIADTVALVSGESEEVVRSNCHRHGS